MIQIDITEHSRKRAKQRFKLKPSSLKRMAIKAVQQGTKETQGNHLSYVYGHYRFIFQDKGDKLVLTTVTDMNNTQSHKESYQKEVFFGGKSVGKKCIKGGYF